MGLCSTTGRVGLSSTGPSSTQGKNRSTGGFFNGNQEEGKEEKKALARASLADAKNFHQPLERNLLRGFSFSRVSSFVSQ
jgi:hypothetical protein